ncbi:penicillin-binding transpeptidase domain-containing protein [Kitasatospora sp. NPDC057965]|uniref:penicillin-binding transpeptidase domain-containing protein n=1 Tax=Kitasatospora sp. NPDC057965 TaxID=3346291 RepID=UPI0036DD8550
MRNGAKTGIITGVAVAMLAAGGYGAYSLVGGSDDKGEPAAKEPRTVVAEPPSAEQAAAGAKDFLEAWAAGDLAKAAALTDDPAAATTALSAFRDQVKPSGLTLAPAGPATPAAFASATGTPSPARTTAPATAPATPGDPTATDSASPTASAAPTGVLMGFKARAEFEGTNRVWDYNGFLGVVKMSDDTPAVHWAPSVIHPHLGAGETISVQPLPPLAGNVVDRNNKALNSPSITPLVATVQAKVAKLLADQNKDQSDNGTGVVITNAADQNSTPDRLFTIVDPKPPKPFKLTIDANLQAAAEKAMTDLGGKKGSIVAIEPSTGQVLAFANAPVTGLNRAFQGQLAPGSTLKILTSTALLEAGVNPDTPVPCPTLSSNPKKIPNSFPDAYPNNTLQQDFMISCNTAFIDQGLTSLKPGALTTTAKDVYGIGLNWQTGLPSFDAVVPDAGTNKDEQAMQSIGQGKVQMNPLAIASITATVQSGSFKQPILVAELPQQKAARDMTPDVAGKLRQMMAATATGGTAQGVMAGISDNAGAKTGSAEATGIATTNSWFTAYRGNLAVAAEVEGGGHGVDAAGPAVASIIKAAGNR